ncbi:Trp biosynthesis-associated membrane protein [Phytoactinopolyspora mesophila]|uniref:TIGR02234 family membrane protein n=1 Tax=Phytoactinopolyspora mesophila TaxID=2650750 RepID=A0A7K3LWR5_9ACTN|nr:Trp biosynthesis-associated membrane protein [Phytoactinopolyspora mesophila]NDL55459.1 hypothetical protein [Phytoactinopolyspora mesophila]
MVTKSLKREYLAALGLLAAGGVLGLVARGQTWGSAEVPSAFTVTVADVSGADLAPFVSAVPFVALAAVLLVPAVRRIGRRVAGAVLVILGAAAIVNAAVVGSDLSARTQRWIAGSADHSGSIEAVTTSAGWVIAAGLGAFAVVVAGLLVAVRGPVWPGMGSRYERPSKQSSGEPGPDRPGTESAVVDAADTWDALDRGDDPTA